MRERSHAILIHNGFSSFFYLPSVGKKWQRHFWHTRGAEKSGWMCRVGWTRLTGSPNTAKKPLCFIFNLSVSWDKRKRGLPDTRLQVKITNFMPAQCACLWQRFGFILKLQLRVLRKLGNNRGRLGKQWHHRKMTRVRRDNQVKWRFTTEIRGVNFVALADQR